MGQSMTYRRVAAALVLALLPVIGHPQATSVSGVQKITFDNGETYVGRVADGKPDGHGILHRLNGETYDGEFAAGIPHGTGTWKFADGSIYEGQWVQGVPNGRGKQVWKNGTSYDGQWSAGKPHGRGTFHFADGSVYEGDWVAGQQTGAGKQVWRDGSSYEGQWRNANPNGQGVYRWADGSSKSGSWVNGQLSGHGVEVLPTGERLEGEFAAGRASGKGTLVWADGSRYEGDFRDGARTGHGTWTNRAGDRYEGEWVNGRRNGRGVRTYDGGSLEGVWKDDALVTNDEHAPLPSMPTARGEPVPSSARALAVAAALPQLDTSALRTDHFGFVRAAALVTVRTPEQLLADCHMCVKFKAELCFKGATAIIVHQPARSGCRPWLAAEPDLAAVRSGALAATPEAREAGKKLFAQAFDLVGSAQAAAAIAAFEKGIASDPGDMKARYAYANALLGRGRVVEAVEQYTVVSRLADIRSEEAIGSATRLRTLFP